MIDMTDSIAPRSDQANADDFMGGPRTFTISKVEKLANPDQPINVYLAEFDPARPFKPSKSMRRVMVAAWGGDGSAYVGRRMTLYRDPAIRFGKDEVGGIRISHLSHIGKPMTLSLTVTRGKRAPYVVQPLPDDAPSAATPELLAELVDTFDRKGIAEEQRLAGASRITGKTADSLEALTQAEARQVLATLATRPDVAPAEDPDEPEGWQE